MNRRNAALFAGIFVGAAASCARPGGDIMADYEVIPSASVPVPPLEVASAPRASASSSVGAPSSIASGATSASSAASASSSEAAGSSSAGKPPPPPEKTFDCGDKGKPDCPMQRWMKGMPSSAAMSGEADKLARAFQAIASHPVAGMGSWASIASTGASIAAGGDFDAAKKQCKACHSRYQSAYHKTMRDMKWP